MKRRLFNIITIASLALCISAVPLWVRSIHVVNGVGLYLYGNRAVALISIGGTLRFVCVSEQRSIGERVTWISASFNNSVMGHYGFEFFTAQQGLVVGVPYWFIMLILVSLSWWARHRSINWTHRPGLCPTCGYDLRATPERCPECGTVAVKPGREMKGA